MLCLAGIILTTMQSGLLSHGKEQEFVVLIVNLDRGEHTNKLSDSVLVSSPCLRADWTQDPIREFAFKLLPVNAKPSSDPGTPPPHPAAVFLF